MAWLDARWTESLEGWTDCPVRCSESCELGPKVRPLRGDVTVTVRGELIGLWTWFDVRWGGLLWASYLGLGSMGFEGVKSGL